MMARAGFEPAFRPTGLGLYSKLSFPCIDQILGKSYLSDHYPASHVGHRHLTCVYRFRHRAALTILFLFPQQNAVLYRYRSVMVIRNIYTVPFTDTVMFDLKLLEPDLYVKV